MLLVLDVGNTNTVIGLYDGESLVEHWRVATNPRQTTDELGVLFMSLFQARSQDPRRVMSAICACVVPPMVHAITRATRRYFDVDVSFVDANLASQVTLTGVNPREIGADRLVNAVAAHRKYERTCIIVDFGTATTFDVLGADGAYHGGVIAPGIGISLEALTQRASKLPRVEIQRPPSVIGTRTVHSMQSGIVYGYVGLVDGLVERLLEEIRMKLGTDDVRVVATGGLANLIAEDSAYIQSVEPFLTLEGLRLLALGDR
jgi:type III pantothenate kinase